MAAPTPTAEGFAEDTEQFRPELLAHCYRMLGSVDDAEDLVQETYLRAWRSYSTFEGRSSLRVWLYRIATNACLTALESRGRRPLPSGLGAPSDDPEGPMAMTEPSHGWLQPIPDSLVGSRSGDPAAAAVLREGLRLALVASLQYLPPRQRAVLLLREVLDVPAVEVGQMLGMSTVAVKSALQRARRRIEEVSPSAEQVVLPTEPEQRALLETYIEAFEKADSGALEKALTRDAVLEVTPSLSWFSGLETCMRHLRRSFGAPGEWIMEPTRANGQPAAVAYRRDSEGVHRAFGVAVLGMRPEGIDRITVFSDPALVATFGFPEVVPA
jgi:RNA polymerase sigma-70 factor (ECF subfamily)